MPNNANIRLVVDAIRTGDGHKHIGFNMNFFEPQDVTEYAGWGDQSGRGCGTVMCIGGWAHVLAGGLGDCFSYRTARDFLGLDLDEASRLFEPEDVCPDYKSITADHAIAVLEHLIATGKVDWTVGAP